MAKKIEKWLILKASNFRRETSSQKHPNWSFHQLSSCSSKRGLHFESLFGSKNLVLQLLEEKNPTKSADNLKITDFSYFERVKKYPNHQKTHFCLLIRVPLVKTQLLNKFEAKKISAGCILGQKIKKLFKKFNFVLPFQL